MAKISNLAIGLTILVGVMAILVTYQSRLVVSTGQEVPAEYNETFQILSDIDSISREAETYKEEAYNENRTSNDVTQFFDIIGKYYERGVKTVNLVPKLLNLFDNMSRSLIGNNVSILGIAFNPVVFMITTGAVLLVTFLFVSVLLKWEL